MELLAPAGDLERLKMALLYGADAVYIGGKDYSLRANAKNFSIDEIKESCDFAHKLGKKVKWQSSHFKYEKFNINYQIVINLIWVKHI